MKIFLSLAAIALVGLGAWYWYAHRGATISEYGQAPLAAIEETPTPLITAMPVYTPIPTPRPVYHAPRPTPTPGSAAPVFVTMNEIDGSGQYGTAAITAEANGQATVWFNLVGPAYNGTYQPAYIYNGTCNDPGAIAYPLNTLFGGSSRSTLDASFNQLVYGSGALAIVVQTESGLRTACGQLR